MIVPFMPENVEATMSRATALYKSAFAASWSKTRSNVNEPDGVGAPSPPLPSEASCAIDSPDTRQGTGGSAAPPARARASRAFGGRMRIMTEMRSMSHKLLFKLRAAALLPSPEDGS